MLDFLEAADGRGSNLAEKRFASAAGEEGTPGEAPDPAGQETGAA